MLQPLPLSFNSLALKPIRSILYIHLNCLKQDGGSEVTLRWLKALIEGLLSALSDNLFRVLTREDDTLLLSIADGI